MTTEQAVALNDLFEELRQRLGRDFFRGQGGFTFVQMPSGKLGVAVGDTRYWRVEGEIGVSRQREGRVEVARLEEDGRMVWTMVPLGPASSN